MTQIAVSAGSSSSISLAAGSKVLLTGQGTYRIGPLGTSQRPTVDELIDTMSTVGPFSDSCTVQVWATGNGATYEVVLPTDVLDQTGRPALVSGAWADPAYNWVNRGTPAANAGKVYHINDIGRPGAGTWWTADGFRDYPFNGRAPAFGSSMPIFMPPNGNMGANGALSGLVTALDTIYNAAAGGCWMYFATGQVYAGSVGGFYYVQMTSTTAGTVFDNRLSGGWPSAPTTPTPIVAAGPGGYTGDSGTDRVALTITVPGGALSRFRSELAVQANVAASGTRFAKCIYGAYAYHVIGLTNTNTFARTFSEFENFGVPSKQREVSYVSGSGYNGNVVYSPTTSSTDSSVDQTLTVTLRNTSGSDWLMLTMASGAYLD